MFAETARMIMVAGSLCSASCALFSAGTQADRAAAPVEIPQQTKDMMRDTLRQMAASTPDNTAILEEDLVHALKLTLGRVAIAPGLRKTRASTTVRALRKAGAPLQTELAVDEPAALPSLKLADAAAASKHRRKLRTLNVQLRSAAMPAWIAGGLLTSTTLLVVTHVAQFKATHRDYQMKWTDEDHELVAKMLSSQRRAETLAGIALGLSATYQAVIDGAEPKTLDEFASKSLAAFPIDTSVSSDEARAYVDTLEDRIDAAVATVEAQMRKAYGDAAYEKHYEGDLKLQLGSLKGMAREGSRSAADERRPRRWARRRNRPSQARAGDIAAALSHTAGPIGAVLSGLQAIRNRDAKGVIAAAVALVPPGPARTALRVAGNVIEALPAAKQRVSATDQRRSPLAR